MPGLAEELQAHVEDRLELRVLKHESPVQVQKDRPEEPRARTCRIDRVSNERASERASEGRRGNGAFDGELRTGGSHLIVRSWLQCVCHSFSSSDRKVDP